MNQPSYEKDFQMLFDTAGKILEATYTDEQLTRQAIQALTQTRERLEQRLNQLSQNIEHTIKSSASITATEAANLLHQKFEEADRVAEQVTQRYRRAAKTLGWKFFVGALFLQICFFITMWLIVSRTIPSYEEIQARRSEIARLEQ